MLCKKGIILASFLTPVVTLMIFHSFSVCLFVGFIVLFWGWVVGGFFLPRVRIRLSALF